MSFGDDWLKNGLPTYHGGKDKSLARGMLDAMGGPEGFKKSYRTNPDGSVTMVHTRGNMPPEVTTTEIKTPGRMYYEIDTDLRTYHDDHENYHLGKILTKPLSPYYLKHIKTVVFTGLTLIFEKPDDADVTTFYSARTITPKNNWYIDFKSYYPWHLSGANAAISNGSAYYEKGYLANDTSSRTFFPKTFVRNTDGMFFTEYEPIKTITLIVDGNEIVLHFLNPVDRSFAW